MLREISQQKVTSKAWKKTIIGSQRRAQMLKIKDKLGET